MVSPTLTENDLNQAPGMVDTFPVRSNPRWRSIQSARSSGAPDESYPCPSCGRRSRKAVRSVPGFSRCLCGLVCNDHEEPPEDYQVGYFTAEAPDVGHRDFESDASRLYDESRFGTELDWLGPVPANGRLLDVGSATGSYLRIAATRGWHGIGVEISPEARAIAAATGVDSSPDIDDVAGLGPFHLITLHHVLEHLVDPVGTLQRLRGLLAPGGRILIEVPNWRSTERRAMGPQWMDLRPNQHRWQWEPRTLRRACEAAGLAVQRVSAPGEPIPSARSVLRSVGVPERWVKAAAERCASLLSGSTETPSVDALSATPVTGSRSPSRPSRAVISVAAHLVDAIASRFLLGKRLVAEVTARPD